MRDEKNRFSVIHDFACDKYGTIPWICERPCVLAQHLTKTSSAAASEGECGCGLKGFSHLKTGHNDGSPSAAAIG